MGLPRPVGVAHLPVDFGESGFPPVGFRVALFNIACQSPSVLALTADQTSLRLSGIAMPKPECSIDGDIWRIVHLAAYDQAHPLFAGV